MSVLCVVFAFFGLVGDGHIPDCYSVLTDPDTRESMFEDEGSDSKALSGISPGKNPDGDWVSIPVFSKDGSKSFIPNRFTNNVTVIDWNTKTTDTTFSVNGGPVRLCCSSKFLVVSMANEKLVELYDLSDYSLVASHKITGREPWNIRISDDDQYAYIGCDGVYGSDECVKIDLQHPTSSPFVMKEFASYNCVYRGSFYNNRTYNDRSNFQILPGGEHYVFSSTQKLLFCNTTTGQIDHALNLGGTSPRVELSGDGKYLIVWTSRYPAALAQVDLATFSISSAVEITGTNRLFSSHIAVNNDGSKAFISVEGRASYLINFSTGTYKRFDSTGSPDWIFASPDHSLAICGGTRANISLLDFDSEQIVTSVSGHSELDAAICDGQNYFATINPILYEGFYCYSFSNSSLEYQGEVLSGFAPEGDAPRAVAIAPDGSVAVVANMLSNNISVLNTQTLEIDAVVEVGPSPVDVAVTHDSKWVVVALMNGVKVINLETKAIVAHIKTGFKCNSIALSSDDKYAYVVSVADNSVLVIELNGASSSLTKRISCPGVGMVPWGTVTRANAALTPDGLYCLVAGTFKDKVYVIDRSTNTVAATLAVGDQPLIIAVNSASTRAVVTNHKGNSFSLINIDGAASSVVCSKSVGNKPLRVAYDVVSDRFAVGYDAGVVTINPATGDITDTKTYPSRILDLEYADDGSLLVLASRSGKFYRGELKEILAGDPTCFDYNNIINAAVIVSPGPDLIQYLKFTSVSVEETDITYAGLPVLSVSPNPGATHFSFTVSLPDAGEMKLSVYDISGRLVATVNEGVMAEGTHTFTWREQLSSGVYSVRLDVGGKSVSKLVTVCE